MSDTASTSLEIAFQLIDSITTIKDVLGAMIVDLEGEVIAQDFKSVDEQERGVPIAAELLPKVASSIETMKLGLIEDMVLQTTGTLVRAIRRDQIVAVVFAEPDINQGMLNVDLKKREDMLKALVGEAIISEMDSERENLYETLRTDGSIRRLIEERPELSSLRSYHGIMFQTAMDLGVDRETLLARLNDINYRIYRDSLLDIGFDFFNRKTLDNYDPLLARQVVSEQMVGMASMIMEKMPS
jgi:predicted regulator of Ras-like GTPase activity (Roadblock/LC7/MglB family)